MNEHDLAKGLEVWMLQTLVDTSILMGLLASGLLLADAYRRAVEKRFGLLLSREAWRGVMVAAPDVLLTGVVLVGFLALNPDVMADAKIALPFYPVATLLFMEALTLRVFKGGHEAGSQAFHRSLGLTLLANFLNILGFAFVAEGASDEYLLRHPSPAWSFVRTHLRSNADPAGLRLAQITFYVCFPVMILLAVRAVRAGLQTIAQPPPDPRR